MNRGQQVRLQFVNDDGDALLEANEFVQFYGQALDDEPDTVLSYNKPSNPVENLYEARDFTDVNAYFLTLEAGNQPAMAVRDATPGGGSPKTSYTATAHAEVDDPTLFVPVPAELLFWPPFQSETSAMRVRSR